MNTDKIEVTGERLARIEERLKSQGKQLDGIDVKFSKQLDDIDTKLDLFVLKADERYASRAEVSELKRGLYALAGIIVTAAVGVLVHFIFFV